MNQRGPPLAFHRQSQEGSGDRQRQQLNIVAEKTLPKKCKPRSLAYCPTMDLVALATDDEELHVFRLNGQRVLGVNFAVDDALDYGYGTDGEEEKGEVRCVAWKKNGQLLAAAGSDNKVRIISSYRSKTVFQYPTIRSGDDDASKEKPTVTCIGWCVNFTDKKATEGHLEDSNGQLSIDDLLAPDSHPTKATALLKADLPRELALLDVESSLPKLSILPGTGSEEDVFSSRASIDAIFHSSTKSFNDSVDVLVVGFNNGMIHLRIFDSFEIGSFSVSAPGETHSEFSALLHASHPMSSTHALLVSDPKADLPLKLLTVDLRFITKSGRYLCLLASKTTQLQNLLRYINQVQRQIQIDWKNAQDLPARFMRSINEDLREKCHCDFVTAAYHLVVTGDCFPPLKEFLVDIVGERGHKRWEKAVVSGYENVRRFTHESLLPALERCEVILSRLIGISKFHKLNHILGLETRDLQEIVDTLDCLHFLAHKILIHSGRELSQFVAFSAWLRHEIDVQTAEPMSQTLEELMEKSGLLDHEQTLEYISGPLTRSALGAFIQVAPAFPGITVTKSSFALPEAWTPAGHDSCFFETYKRIVKQHEMKGEDHQENSTASLPKLNDFTQRLDQQCAKVFQQIALTQRRGILHRCLLSLGEDCSQDGLEMTMRYEQWEGENLPTIYVAARSKSSLHTLYLYRLVLDLLNGVSSMRAAFLAILNLQKGEIRQAQFVEDETVMILWTEEGVSHLLRIPQVAKAQQQTVPDENPSEAFAPIYKPITPAKHTLRAPPDQATILDLRSAHHDLIIHTFPSSGPKSKPLRIEVNGRQGRRAACVLYSDQQHYDILDIDSHDRVEEDDAEETVTSEDEEMME